MLTHISCNGQFLAPKHLLGHSGNLSICTHMANTNTAKLTAVRIIAALAVWNDWELEQTDVDAAYLNASLKEDIYTVCASQKVLKFQVRSSIRYID